jgi:drug/metabolite transporter (DMT)-like permease
VSAEGQRPRRATDARGELMGVGLTVAMAAQFSFVVIWGKSLLSASGHPFLILACRFGGSALALAVLLRSTGRPLLPQRAELRGILFVGIAGYGTESAFYFAALGHGEAAAVTLLFYTYPAIVLVVTSALERRMPSGRLVSALVLATGGAAIVVIAGGSLEVQRIGVILSLCCATAYSGYLIGADRVMKRSDPITSAMWLAIGACLSNTLFAAVFGAEVVPRGFGWLRVAGMAAATVGAFICMLAGLQKLGAVRNAIIGVLEPVFVAVLAAWFLSEPVRSPVALGGALIIAAAVLAARSRISEPVEPVA